MAACYVGNASCAAESRQYKLNDINEAYDDMLAGRNIRGVIIHEH